MHAMTVMCSMTTAACLTLSIVHVWIWLRDRSSIANVGFSLTAAGVAWFAWAEFALMRALSPAQVGAALQSVHTAIFVIVGGIVLFVRFYFRTAHPWLGHMALAIRLVILLVTWSRPTSADYDSISGVTQVAFAGDLVSIPTGQTSIWHWIAQVGFAVLLAYLVHAAVTLWRSGNALERRRATTIGGATTVFATAGPLWAGLIFADVVQWPHIEFLFFVPMVLAMAYELGDDVLRAARLAGDLRVSEAAARQLSGRLINAQEDERRRIARDLHDDLSQRLALLSVEVDLINGGAPDREREERVAHVASAVRDIASEVHRLAYRLHPAKLDQLGFVTATRSWCRDLARQSGIDVEFVAEQVPDQLPPDVALCLYRIVQESLQNVVRHSGSRAARVHVTYDSRRLRLVTSDEGRGFDDADAGASGGLGLVSMRERVRLLEGTMAIRSRSGVGTEVEVTVPYVASSGPDSPARRLAP